MRIVNNLTDDDLRRSMQVPATPKLIAGSCLSLIEACDVFVTDTVGPVLRAVTNRSQREIALIALLYRTITYCESVSLLKSIVHAQSITAAERSVVEIYLDMELLHQNVFSDGPERMFAFVEAQKLKGARRIVAFFDAKPHLDGSPSFAEAHRKFIAHNADAIEATKARLWGGKGGKAAMPTHWSGLNLHQRAAKLGERYELLVAQGYDLRNFVVHSGLIGFINLEKSHFEQQCALSLKTIGECTVEELRIMGKEFGLYRPVPDFWDTVHEIEDIPHFALADAKLRSIGENQRFFLRERARTED